MSGKSIKRHGYIYAKGTKQGFLRMQRRGIPQPAFRLEDSITRVCATVYNEQIDEIARLFSTYAQEVQIDGTLVTDSATESVNRINVQGIVQRLWNNYSSKDGIDIEYLETTRERLNKQFYDDQQQFFNSFFTDADTKIQQIFTSFSVDKKTMFNQHIDDLRKLYIDNAIGRMNGETNDLRKAFLKKLTDYVLGKIDTLDVADIVAQMKQTSVKVARFFARDQISRFNKALTLASFAAAGVKTLRWVTVGDQRVRESHKRLNGKIFDINDLPKEIDDYLCRCGLVPETYIDD